MALHKYSVSKQNTDLIVRTPDSYAYLEKFLMSKGAAGLSPNTLKNYRLTISMFLDCISRPLAELSDDDFIFYLERYRRIRKVSFSRIKNMQNTQALPINRRARQSISSMCKILKCPMDCFQICTMSTAIKSGGSSDGTKSIHSFLFFTAGVSWRCRDYSVHLYRLYHIISPTSTETAQMGSCRGLLY